MAIRPAHRSSDKNKRTVYTSTARRDNGQWYSVFYQTPWHPLTSAAPIDAEPPTRHDRARFPFMRSRATHESGCPGRAERL